MKLPIRLALALYPRWWRRRYGAEMEALLADAGVGWRAVLDLVGGALIVRLGDFGGTMRRVSALLVLIPTLVGAFTMFIVAKHMPPRYRAEALVEMITPAPTRSTIENRLEVAAANVITRARLERIIADLNLYRGERSRPLSLLESTNAMREAIELIPGTPGESLSPWFRVRFEAADPQMAMMVVDRLVELFASTRQDVGEADRLRGAAIEKERRLLELETTIQDARRRGDGRAKHVSIAAEYNTLSIEHRGLLAGIEQANLAASLERRDFDERFSIRDASRTTPIPPRPLPMSAQGAAVGFLVGLLLLAGRIARTVASE